MSRPGFRRLLAAEVVSQIGDWLTYVAVGVLAIEQGRGAWAVVTVLVAHTLPRALAAPLAGWLADRRDRRALLVGASLARGAVVVAMALAAHGGGLWAVQALLLVRTALGAVVDAPLRAALPQVVPAAEVGIANVVLGAAWSVVFGLGVVAGGVLTEVVGPTAVLAMDAVTFAVAAGLFAGLGRLPPGGALEASSPPRLSAVVRRRPDALGAALDKMPVAVLDGAAFVLLHAAAPGLGLAGVAVTLGALHAVRAAGTFLGPIAWQRAPRLAGTRAGVDASLGLAFSGLYLLAADATWAVGLGSLLWGAGVGASWVTATTRMQRLAPSAALGRLAAVDLVAHTTARCAGGALFALAPSDARVAIVSCGLLALAAWSVTRVASRRASPTRSLT